MDDLNVRPGVGIGPIDIGMPRDVAIAAAKAAGLSVEDFRRGPGSGKPDLSINSQLFAYFDDDGLAEKVEVAVPSDGSNDLPVTCLDLDLTASYEVVLGRMAELGRVDETDPEYPGTSVYFDLGLVLWADAKAEDMSEVRVETILVQRPEPYPLG